MEEVPFDDRHVPRVEIDWDRSAWWWYPLTRAVHPAVRMTSLALSLIAVLLAQAGCAVGDWLFQPSWTPVSGDVLTQNTAYSLQIVVWMAALVQSLLSFTQIGLSELAFLSFELLWLTTTFALLGGVIARRGLVELGQRTIAPWGESFRIVFSRWQSYLWATAMHLVGIALLLLPIAILGFFSRFGATGATICGVLLLLGFPLVFAVGRFAVSLFVCFPLSVCAIGAEKKADAFEGFSRSNAYFFQRPVVGVLCAILLIAIGVVGEQIVDWTLRLGWGLISGAYLYSGGMVQPASNTYVGAGNWLARSLVAAYWFSFFWSASAAIYLILRKSVDHTEMDEIDAIESALEQSLPEIPSATEPAGGPESSPVEPSGQGEGPGESDASK